MNRLIKFLLILLLAVSYGYTQNDQSVVARVGNTVISKEEFLTRYELTPQMFRSNDKIKSELKLEFLYSLIAEKLLALYGDEIKLDTLDVVRRSLKSFEELFVRDALYKKVISMRAYAKTDSLVNFYLANANNVKLIYIKSVNEEELNDIYQLLELGMPFDSLYVEVNTGVADTLTISVGDLNEDAENKIFPLPDEAVTLPIKMNEGWYIFKIISRLNPIIAKPTGWEAEFKRISQIARERAELEVYQNYIGNFFGNKNVKINAKLLRSLAWQIFVLLEKKTVLLNSNQNLFLKSSDLPFLEQELGADTIQMTFVQIEDVIITLKDFLHFFRFENFKVEILDYKNIFTILSNKVKKYVEYKILSDEGYRLGLQNDEEVKRQVQMWKENYYMQLVTTEFIDSANVSDDEMIEYYNLKRSKSIPGKEVNVLQLLSDSLSIIESVFDKINAGEDFEQLVKDYAKSNTYAGSNGETGFFPVSSSGELGRLAASMQIGEIYGPLSVHDGYMIFKLIGVRKDSSFLTKDYNEIKNELEKEVGYFKKNKSYNNFIVRLANKYNVNINSRLLDDINVTHHQSLVYYYPGFGSRILAVPLLNINMDWVPEWLENPEKIQ